jgi:hypothetical protein
MLAFFLRRDAVQFGRKISFVLEMEVVCFLKIFVHQTTRHHSKKGINLQGTQIQHMLSVTQEILFC